MSDRSEDEDVVDDVEIQLLDASSGRPIKSWTFTQRAQITIGRSPDQDVEISDPYVSRNHASLVFREGEWLLVSLGRHGVIVDHEPITEYAVQGDVSFRLGNEGPTLRFRTATEHNKISATITFDSLPAPMFQLDENKLQDEVGEIVEGDFFQTLKERAKQLRRHRVED